ncbi:MAG TPA: zinc ribbon domain-containing protein [Ktedonobacteraceae bacterium]
MPLWDSVQRSLEKASQEAARIARTQRLRSTIDALARQINTQHSSIVNKAMDMFVAGQLASSDLLPLCQEMMNLQQELYQTRIELQQLQAQASQAQATMPQAGAPHSPVQPGQGVPTEYQSYLDSTSSVAVPPPPPGVESLMVIAVENAEMNQEVPISDSSVKKLCSICQAELFPNNAFCQSCGAPVQANDSEHQPTMRGGTLEHIYPTEEATIRADEPAPPSHPNPPSPPSPQIQQSPEAAAQNEEV